MYSMAFRSEGDADADSLVNDVSVTGNSGVTQARSP